MKAKVILNYDDFKTLISGEIVKKDEVNIILSDIGYDNMINAILMEYRKSNNISEDENPGI